jgi:hypothetical protein
MPAFLTLQFNVLNGHEVTQIGYPTIGRLGT